MRKLSILSLAHFCVDLCSAALFFGRLDQGIDWWLYMVLYNGCAFALQFPMGLLADRLDRDLPFAAAGCALVAGSFFLTGSPLLSALLCGIGNGMFHVGGGLEVLSASDRAAPLGVFVSPGAVGLYLGTVWASFLMGWVWTLPALMGLMGLLILLPGKGKGSPISHNAPLSLALPKGGMLPLLCLFLVVALRSRLSGDAFSAGLQDVPGVLPVLCLASGKAAGGFLGDGLGLRRTAALSLGAAAILLLFPADWTSLLGMFLFNMTMPLTLLAAARLLPGAKGCAFGLLTLALFVGMMPRFLDITQALPGLFGAAQVLLSLGLLWAGLGKERAHG